MFYLLTFDFDFADSYPTVAAGFGGVCSFPPPLSISLSLTHSFVGFVLFTSARKSENLKKKLFVGKSLCTLAEAEES